MVKRNTETIQLGYIKQKSTVWVFQDEANPAWLFQVKVNDCRTENAEGHTTICLPSVFAKMKKTNASLCTRKMQAPRSMI